MPGLVDCHFHPSQYFANGRELPSLFDVTLNAVIPGELMFRNATFAREESMRIVVRAVLVCLFLTISVETCASLIITEFYAL